jgi:hypothetical protein
MGPPDRVQTIRNLSELSLRHGSPFQETPWLRRSYARLSMVREERTQRRRRLTRGPQEFRENRADLLETKGGK